MSTTLERYNSSGRFGPLTVVYAVGGAVALTLLAWVYQLALTWIPFIYIEFILVGGFGFAAGLAVTMIMDMGHCRNRGVGALLGLVLGAVGLAASFWWGCHEQSFLSIKESVSTTNSKGQVEEKSTDIIELVTLTPELSDLFTARFMAPQRGPELSPA